MKRIVARFEDEDDAQAAKSDLRSAGLDTERPTFENPYFDPTARVPEEGWLLIGFVVGGLVGLLVLEAMNVGLLAIPRTSPLMSAGEYAVPTLGFGLGAVIGSFLGGVVGTLRPLPTTEESKLAVEAPDDRIDETAAVLREHDATEVAGRVTVHENPGTSSRD